MAAGSAAPRAAARTRVRPTSSCWWIATAAPAAGQPATVCQQYSMQGHEVLADVKHMHDMPETLGQYVLLAIGWCNVKRTALVVEVEELEQGSLMRRRGGSAGGCASQQTKKARQGALCTALLCHNWRQAR